MKHRRRPPTCTTPHPNGQDRCDRDAGHDDGQHYYLDWQLDSRGNRYPLPPVWWTAPEAA